MNLGYTSLLVDVHSTQCVKSFNRSVHSALLGKNFEQNNHVETLSTRFLNTVWYSKSIHIAFQNFIFFPFYAILNFVSIRVRLIFFSQGTTDWRSEGRAIESLMQDQKQQQVAKILWLMSQLLNVLSDVYRKLIICPCQEGYIKDLPRSGRPRVTSLRQDRQYVSHICSYSPTCHWNCP